MKTPSRGSAPKRPERRRGNRPKTGDVRACPRCRLGEIEFNERYRVDGQTIPAWLCDNAQCGYRELVRVPMTPAGSRVAGPAQFAPTRSDWRCEFAPPPIARRSCSSRPVRAQRTRPADCPPIALAGRPRIRAHERRRVRRVWDRQTARRPRRLARPRIDATSDRPVRRMAWRLVGAARAPPQDEQIELHDRLLGDRRPACLRLGVVVSVVVAGRSARCGSRTNECSPLRCLHVKSQTGFSFSVVGFKQYRSLRGERR